MSKIIGIDLGTTNSVMAVIEAGEACIVPTADGRRLCPSVLAFNKNGERLVGETAKRQAVINPENTVYSIKRFMGRRLTEVEHEQQLVSYRIRSGPVGDVRVKIPQTGREYSPQELSAQILAKLKADAEAYLGSPVTQAVITVPAYFNDSQRQATRDAGRIAGLEVLRIINEPTAAALAYGLDKQTTETVLVFDLGGGTFDVSVLEVGDGVVQVRSTNGDTHLGGDDWDQEILDWAADEFQREQGIDLRQDRQALQRLREAAEKAKIELSTLLETELSLPYITATADGPKHLHLRLPRARFEQLSQGLLERLKTPFTAALQDAGLSIDGIDEVVLVGGATRMPMVQTLVRTLTGKEAHKGVNPDEVVAIGAAIQAGVLAGEITNLLLLDVTPLSLGLETLGGVMTVLIERNTTIPVKKAEVFSTAVDNQPGVDIHVLQGERPRTSQNMSLGRFRLDGLPPAARGVPQIEVSFDVDANGILNVSAQDKATGKHQQVTMLASTNLNEAEIEALIQEAREHEAEDQHWRELAEVRNQVEHQLYQIEAAMAELGPGLPNAARLELETRLEELRQAQPGDDLPGLRRLLGELQKTWQAISQQLAQPPDPAQAGSPNRPGWTAADADVVDNIVEGEFRDQQ